MKQAQVTTFAGSAIQPIIGAILGTLLARKQHKLRGAGYGALIGLGGALGREAGGGLLGGAGRITGDRANELALGSWGMGAGNVGGALGVKSLLKHNTSAKDYPWHKSNVEDDEDNKEGFNMKQAAEDITIRQPEDKTSPKVPASAKAEKGVDKTRDASLSKVDKPEFDVTTKMDSQEQTVEAGPKDVKSAYVSGVIKACAERGIDPRSLPGFDKVAQAYMSPDEQAKAIVDLTTSNSPLRSAAGTNANVGVPLSQLGSDAMTPKIPVTPEAETTAIPRVPGPSKSWWQGISPNWRMGLGLGAGALGAYGLYKLYKWLRGKPEKEASAQADYVGGMIKACEARGIDPESIKLMR